MVKKRIAAMKLARDNACKLLERLGLEYSLVHQSALTSELLEIVTGYQAVEAGSLD